MSWSLQWIYSNDTDANFVVWQRGGGPCFEGNQLDKFGKFPPLSQSGKFRISSNCFCHVGWLLEFTCVAGERCCLSHVAWELANVSETDAWYYGRRGGESEMFLGVKPIVWIGSRPICVAVATWILETSLVSLVSFFFFRARILKFRVNI